MKLVIGSDHAGFQLKVAMGDLLRSLGHEVLDVGAFNENPSDYPDFAEAVGRAVLDRKAERGVLICGSGVGASVAANKLPGLRAGICRRIKTLRKLWIFDLKAHLLARGVQYSFKVKENHYDYNNHDSQYRHRRGNQSAESAAHLRAISLDGLHPQRPADQRRLKKVH